MTETERGKWCVHWVLDWGRMVTLTGVVAGLLGSCASLEPLVPVEGLFSFASPAGNQAVDSVAERGLKLTLDVREYVTSEPRGVVILVHGLGSNINLWDLPNGEGLARVLWRQRYHVYSVGWPTEAWLGATGMGGLDSLLSGLRVLSTPLEGVLDWLDHRHPGLPLIGIGHGLGGTLLLTREMERHRFAGLAMIGAPLDFGGASWASRSLWDRMSRSDSTEYSWSSLPALVSSDDYVGGRSYQRLLLSDVLPYNVMHQYLHFATAPFSYSVLQWIRANQKTSPVPRRNSLIDSLDSQSMPPLLVLMAPVSGFWPTWQCDPLGFGAKHATIKRVYLTQANGMHLEYNHLDMVAHPFARKEVDPIVVEWLEGISSLKAGPM